MVETSNTGDGENLFGICCLGYFNVSHAVSSWYSEGADYNFTYPGYSLTTGHFTQVRTTPCGKLTGRKLFVLNRVCFDSVSKAWDDSQEMHSGVKSRILDC